MKTPHSNRISTCSRENFSEVGWELNATNGLRVTIHKHFSVLYTAIIGNGSHNTSIADRINFVITCRKTSDCCLITKSYLTTHHKCFLFKFSENTFVSSNVEMFKFTNDLVYSTFKFFIYRSRPVVNSFRKRNFEQVSRSCSAICKFVNLINRYTIYMSSNVP